MIEFDKPFWGKVWKAAQNIIGALVLLGLHRLLDWALSCVLGEWEQVQMYAHGTLLFAFLIIYFILILNAVFIFVPKPKLKRRGRSHVVRHAKEQN